MKPIEVVFSLLIAIITTATFTLVSYFYRLAIEEISFSSGYPNLYNLLEITTGKVIFMFLGSFVLYLLACKWMGDHYKPMKVTTNDHPRFYRIDVCRITSHIRIYLSRIFIGRTNSKQMGGCRE